MHGSVVNNLKLRYLLVYFYSNQLYASCMESLIKKKIVCMESQSPEQYLL